MPLPQGSQMNNDLKYAIRLLLSHIFILGKKWPLRSYRNKEVTGCLLLLVLKGLSLLATGSQSSDIGFQIQEKNNPLDSLLICFFLAPLTPLSNDFKVPASVIRLQLSWLMGRWGRKSVLTLWRHGFMESQSVSFFLSTF